MLALSHCPSSLRMDLEAGSQLLSLLPLALVEGFHQPSPWQLLSVPR